MFDRAVLASLVLCLTIATQPAVAQSETSESYRITALDLLEYLRTGSRLDVLKKAIVDREIKRDKRMKEFRPELLAHVNKYMPWEDVRESLVSAYTTAFTEEDLKSILAFYQSPAGVKVLNHMERLNQAVFAAAAKHASDNADELRFQLVEETQKQAADKNYVKQ